MNNQGLHHVGLASVEGVDAMMGVIGDVDQSTTMVRTEASVLHHKMVLVQVEFVVSVYTLKITRLVSLVEATTKKDYCYGPCG